MLYTDDVCASNIISVGKYGRECVFEPQTSYTDVSTVKLALFITFG